MNTQMHSLREQPQILKNYRKFSANDRSYKFGFGEFLGALALSFCVGYTVFSFSIGG